MTKDEIRAVILTGILQDLEFFTSDRGRVLFSAHQNRSGQLLRRKVINAAGGVASYKPSNWFGRSLTGTERSQLCRVLPQLEEEGLLICYTNPQGRTTRVALTETGRELAERLLEVAG